MRLTVANYRDEFRARPGRHSAANKAPRRRVMASILISQRTPRADQRQERSSRRSVGITAAILIRASRRRSHAHFPPSRRNYLGKTAERLRKPGFISVSRAMAVYLPDTSREINFARQQLQLAYRRPSTVSRPPRDRKREKERERERRSIVGVSPKRGGCR